MTKNRGAGGLATLMAAAAIGAGSLSSGCVVFAHRHNSRPESYWRGDEYTREEDSKITRINKIGLTHNIENVSATPSGNGWNIAGSLTTHQEINYEGQATIRTFRQVDNYAIEEWKGYSPHIGVGFIEDAIDYLIGFPIDITLTFSTIGLNKFFHDKILELKGCTDFYGGHASPERKLFVDTTEQETKPARVTGSGKQNAIFDGEYKGFIRIKTEPGQSVDFSGRILSSDEVISMVSIYNMSDSKKSAAVSAMRSMISREDVLMRVDGNRFDFAARYRGSERYLQELRSQLVGDALSIASRPEDLEDNIRISVTIDTVDAPQLNVGYSPAAEDALSGERVNITNDRETVILEARGLSREKLRARIGNFVEGKMRANMRTITFNVRDKYSRIPLDRASVRYRIRSRGPQNTARDMLSQYFRGDLLEEALGLVQPAASNEGSANSSGSSASVRVFVPSSTLMDVEITREGYRYIENTINLNPSDNNASSRYTVDMVPVGDFTNIRGQGNAEGGVTEER